MDTIPFLVIIVIAGYLGWFSFRIQQKKDQLIEVLEKQLVDILSSGEVHISLEDMEEMFMNGKERTYDTPHGILHVSPDPKHVLLNDQ